MRLASYEALADHLNLASHLASETTLNSALDLATTYIESVIRTPLAKRNLTDYFTVRRSRLATFSPYILGLTQKFSSNVVVKASPDGKPITDLPNATLLVDGTDYVIEGPHGDIEIIRDVVLGTHVLAVTYDCGFQDEHDTTIPEWLRSAALSTATLIRHTNAITHNRKDYKDLSPEIRKQVYVMLAHHIIPHGGCLYPSKVVENA